MTRLVPGPVSPATARAGHCGGRGLDGREGGKGFRGVLSNLSTVFTQRAAWDRHCIGGLGSLVSILNLYNTFG